MESPFSTMSYYRSLPPDAKFWTAQQWQQWYSHDPAVQTWNRMLARNPARARGWQSRVRRVYNPPLRLKPRRSPSQIAKRRLLAIYRREGWAYVKEAYSDKSRDFQRGYVQAYVDHKDDDVFSKM